jgi:hypothetical protein
MKRSGLGVRFFIMMDSDNAFSGHTGAVFVSFVVGYAQVHIRKLLDCKNKMQK